MTIKLYVSDVKEYLLQNDIGISQKQARSERTLIEWLKVRSSYLSSSVNKNKGQTEVGIGKPKNEFTDKLFPFTDGVASQFWLNAITKAGLLTRDALWIL